MIRFKNNLPIYLGVFIPFVIFSFVLLKGARVQHKSVDYSNVKILTAVDYVENSSSDEVGYKQVKQEYVEGDVLVKFKKDKLDINRLDGKLKKSWFSMTEGVDIQDEFSKNNLVLVKIPENDNVFDKISDLENNSNVEYAEPNYIQHLMSSSNDTNIATQYAINNTGQTVNGTAGTADADMDVFEMWDIESASASDVTVAIIDTGLSSAHTDIAGNAVAGYDFTNSDSTPEDTNGHGSHIAGIIAGVSNNSSGISGLSKNNHLKVMPLKVSFPLTFYEAQGNILTSDTISAISYAQSNNVKVINYSVGGASYSQSLYDAIQAYTGLFVTSAGNSAANNDTTPSYPASFNLANIISVASTDQNDALSSFSNYGATSVDVAAPGSDINSLDIGKTIYSEDFQDQATTFSISPANSWVLASGSGNYVLITDPFDPYSTNVNSSVNTGNLISSGSISNFGFRFVVYCSLDASNDSDGYNGDIDAGDTDYLNLEYSTDNTNWNQAVRIKSLTSGEETSNSSFTFGKILGSSTSDLRFRYKFITDSTNGGNYGCYLDNIKLIDRAATDTNSYVYKSGTSMAAPQVAGLAGLLWSYKPTLTVAQVKSILMNTGDSLASLSGKTVSGKRVNAYNAYNSLIPPVVAEVTPVTTPTEDTTPNYVFSSTEAGTITYGGSCSSATSTATSGSNTITFNTLAAGATYSNCTIRVTDSDSNVSNTLTVTSFTISSDLTPPTVTEITPIGTTNDVTPSYTFNTTEAGTITYGGSCSSSTTSATSGHNTVTFNTLVAGTYSNCTIRVTDSSSNASTPLSVTSFTITVDSTAPVLSESSAIGTTSDSTPNYTFTSTEIGDITYGGDCSSSTTTASSGSNTITFNSLSTGIHSNCTVTVTDYANNPSNPLSVTSFTVIDIVAPVLTEVTAIGSTTDTTPNYTFSSSEAGDITYGGSCSSSTTTATSGNNTVTFNELALGTYSDCTIIVTDASDNPSTTLDVSDFTITLAPVSYVSRKMVGSTNSSGKYKYGSKVKLSKGDGVDKIEYRWNDKGSWKTYNSKGGITLKEGTSKLSWKAFDNVGTVLEERSKTFMTQKKDPIKDLKGALSEDGTEIKLTWNTAHDKIANFKIYRDTNEDFEIDDKYLIGENAKDDDDFTDKTVEKSAFYLYKVVAFDDKDVLLETETIGSWMNSKIPAGTSQPVSLASASNSVNVSPKVPSVVLGSSDYSEYSNDYVYQAPTPSVERYISNSTIVTVESPTLVGTNTTNAVVNRFKSKYLIIIVVASVLNAILFTIFRNKKQKTHYIR